MRWIRGLVPLAAIALMSTGTVARPPILAAADPPWQPPPCPAAEPRGSVPDVAAWYRLDGVQDASGTLVGQRLTLGPIGGVARAIQLPPESFASGPRDGLVLVGEDDGHRSRLSLVDPARGCATLIADERDVVRSALVSPDGRAVWEHRVARRTRVDLGVWRRPLDGSGATRQLHGAPADARYGRTFATELHWSKGQALAVTSCGEVACRTRIVDPAGGRVSTVGPTGPVLGVAGDGSVVAYRVCGGFPCAIDRHVIGTRIERLVPAAGQAALDGDRLVFEVGRSGLRSMDLSDGRTTVVSGSEGLVPVGAGSRAMAGAEHAVGSVLLAPGGRLDGRTVMVLAPGATTPTRATEATR